jgi:hypothetical protein
MLPTVAATAARPTDWRSFVIPRSAIALTLFPPFRLPGSSSQFFSGQKACTQDQPMQIFISFSNFYAIDE